MLINNLHRPLAKPAQSTYAMVMLLLICGLSPYLSAQKDVDSLETRLAESKGSERLAVLVDLVEALNREAPGQAIAYGREAVPLLPGNNDIRIERRLWYWKGFAHRNIGEYDSALTHAGHMQSLAEASGDRKTGADGEYLKGIVYISRGAYQEALIIFEQVLENYESLADKSGMQKTLDQIGDLYRRQGSYGKALSFSARSLDIAEEIDDKKGVASVHQTIGIIHYVQGNYDQALSSYNRALAIKETFGDRRGIATLLNNIGLVHNIQGEYAEALSALTRSLAIKEELGNRAGIASSLNNIGLIHAFLGDYTEALAFYARALTIREEIGHKAGIASTLNNTGDVYKERGDYEEALSFYTRSLAIREELGNKRLLSMTLGNIRFEQGDYATALSFYTWSLAMQQEIGDKESMIGSLMLISGLHRKQGRFAEALKYSGRALSLADSIAVLQRVREIHKERVIIFEEAGQFEQALNAHCAYKAAHDSLFTSESQSVIAELQQQYKTKEQQQRIQLLQRDQEIQRLWLFGLVAGVLLLAAIVFLTYTRYRLKHRAHQEIAVKNNQLAALAEQLQELDGLKSRFFANISHEFRTPLTLILGPLQRMETELRDSEFGGDLSVAQRNARRLLGLINELLDLSKLESGKMTLQAVKGDIISFLKGLLSTFSTLAGIRHIKLQFKSLAENAHLQPLREVYFDPDKLEKLISNILANAFKFTADGGSIIVDLGVQNADLQPVQQGYQYMEIRISDTGTGIPAEDLPHIFDRFYQARDESGANTDRIGTGIGMALTKELVELHHGKISVESQVQKGTTFIIWLPLGAGHLQEREIVAHGVKVEAFGAKSEERVEKDIAKETLKVDTNQLTDPEKADKPINQQINKSTNHPRSRR